MTAADFLAAGVRFERDGAELAAFGPPGRDDLLEQLRTAINKRARLVRTMPPRLERGDHRCDACLDPLPNGRGGMCALCVLARQKEMARCPTRTNAPAMRSAS